MTGFVITRNRIPALMAAFPAQVDAIVGKVAADMMADSQSRAPIDTGNLRGSHYFKKVAPATYEVGASAAYTIYVELGTRFMRAQPFLIPAWTAGRFRLMQALSRLRL